MTEKLSDEDELLAGYTEISARIAQAARRAGKTQNDILLVAVTKTVSAQRVNAMLRGGVQIIGENRVQEFLSKADSYELDGVSVHFIGHLQTNKVKYIIDKVALIESVDSLRLMQEIDKQARRVGRVMPVYLEVNVGGEESKSGASLEEAEQMLRVAQTFAGLRITGLMAIPPAVGPEESRPYFRKMKAFFDRARDGDYPGVALDFLSMGMSADYEAAIEEGANVVRIGSALFGRRI